MVNNFAHSHTRFLDKITLPNFLIASQKMKEGVFDTSEATYCRSLMQTLESNHFG